VIGVLLQSLRGMIGVVRLELKVAPLELTSRPCGGSLRQRCGWSLSGHAGTSVFGA
jgi:hypothetical protein